MSTGASSSCIHAVATGILDQYLRIVFLPFNGMS